MVRAISDLPHSEVPQNVTIPEGKTDATVSPITSVPVHGAVIGNLRAAYGTSWQQNSLGPFPLLFSLSLDKPAVVGGSAVTGTVTLQRAARRWDRGDPGQQRYVAGVAAREGRRAGGCDRGELFDPHGCGDGPGPDHDQLWELPTTTIARPRRGSS